MILGKAHCFTGEIFVRISKKYLQKLYREDKVLRKKTGPLRNFEEKFQISYQNFVNLLKKFWIEIKNFMNIHGSGNKYSSQFLTRYNDPLYEYTQVFSRRKLKHPSRDVEK